MNYLKFFIGILVLLLAFLLQFWLGAWGFSANLVLGTLVSFAFLFEIWEFSFFILLAIFVMNWQPGLSLDILAFALIPMAAYAGRIFLRPDQWIGSILAIAISIFLFYLLIAPGMIVRSFESFLIDIALSIAFGELALWGILPF